MTRRYGWGPRGERLVDAVPHGHWKTTTFVAGLRRDGVIAPFVLDGPMTGEVFQAYVEQMLAPTLRPRDVVVLDNLPLTRSPASAGDPGGGREPALSAGLLARPEPHRAAFAKLKALLRKAAARTRDALWNTIGRLLDASRRPNARTTSPTRDMSSCKMKCSSVPIP